MNPETWLTVVVICSLGAMSPGPSLAVVLRHSLMGGRRDGLSAAVAHGLGIGLYALLSISGVALLLTRSPTLFVAFQWAGAAYLAWLGWKGLRSKPDPDGMLAAAQGTSPGAARDGFLIVFLNPKVAVFFLALFSQVIGEHTTLVARLGYAFTAMIIDMAWYLVVAWLCSSPRWLDRLRNKLVLLDRLFGLVLLALAVRMVLGTLISP